MNSLRLFLRENMEIKAYTPLIQDGMQKPHNLEGIPLLEFNISSLEKLGLETELDKETLNELTKGVKIFIRLNKDNALTAPTQYFLESDSIPNNIAVQELNKN